MSKYRKELEAICVQAVKEISPLMEQYREAEGTLNSEAMAKEGKRLTGLIEAYKTNAVNEASKVKDDYLDRLQAAADGITGKDINTEDMELLTNDLIELTKREFLILCERNKGSRAMVKALNKYAQKRDFDCPILTDEKKVAIAEQEYRSLKGLVLNGGYGISDYILNMAGTGEMFKAAKQLTE